MRLTKRAIDALVCPPGRKDVLVFDEDLKGFGLRVTAQGSKIFLFQYRSPTGQVRRKVIGEYGVLTPAQARDRAQVLRGQVLAGGDPVGEDREARRAAADAAAAARRRAEADAFTVRALIEHWRDTRLAERRPRYRDEAVAHLMRHFAAWLDRPAHSITPEEVLAELDRIRAAGTPTAALHAYDYGRSAFNWAVQRRRLAASPFAGLPPPADEPERDRVLSDRELGEAWRSAAGLGWPFGPFVQLLMLTLQRRQDVAAMRWAEVSEDLTTWTIPGRRTKNGKEHVVHLAPEARALLRGLPRMAGADLVFTTTGRTPISGYSRAAARQKAAIERERAQLRSTADGDPRPAPPLDWVWHDFRRTGVTRLAQLGFPPHVADKILNHQDGEISGVAAIYQRFEFLAERAQALDAWARYVLAVGEGSHHPAEVGKVIPLQARPRR